MTMEAKVTAGDVVSAEDAFHAAQQAWEEAEQEEQEEQEEAASAALAAYRVWQQAWWAYLKGE
jgi:hypothetical protein